LLNIFIIPSNDLLADKVELKNGKVYENVKAILLKTSLQFMHEEKLLTFKKSEVKRIKLKPVLLKPPVTDKEKEEYEAERIRVAEALQNTNEWEMTANAKPAIVILQFSAGEGIKVNEVETVTNLIRTSLVKTKLFEIVDTSILLKDCPKETKDCSKLLPADVRRNKVITGTVTKLGDNFYVNGNVLDTKKNTIDFAESSSASSVQKLETASETFAKKVAGGIMEYWDEAIIAKDQETYGNVQYLWRSAVLPGWGQIKYASDKEKNYAKYKGIGFASVFSLLFIHTYLSYGDLKKEESSYNAFHNFYIIYPKGSLAEQGLYIEDGRRNQALQDSASQVMSHIYLLGFIYILNVVDSFFPEKYFAGIGTPTKETQALSIQFLPERHSQFSTQTIDKSPYFLISYQWRF
jgi:TolB-like protein